MRPLLVIAMIIGFCFVLLLTIFSLFEDWNDRTRLPPVMLSDEDEPEYSSEGLELPANPESLLRR